MSKQLIRLSGKKHQIPIAFAEFVSDLEDRVDVNLVGIANFGKNRTGKTGIFINGYDSSRHSLILRVRSRDFDGKVYVSVDEDSREGVEKYLRDYDF